MLEIELSTGCNHSTLFHHLDRHNCLSGYRGEVVFLIDYDTYLSPSGLAFLTCWCLNQQEKGYPVNFKGNHNKMNFFSRMDLFSVLDLDYEENFSRHPENGRFITIQRITGDSDLMSARHKICNLVTSTIENARSFLPAMEWSVDEILDNILQHADSSVGGVLCGQYFSKKDRLEIGICDFGRGLMNSLRESYEVIDHKNAIDLAITKGVTRLQGENRGIGLAGVAEINQLNRSCLSIWTGDTVYYKESDKDGYYYNVPTVDGTGLVLNFNTKIDVDIRDTFFTNGDWTFFDYEMERISNNGGIKLFEECNNFGSRDAGKALRLKIQSLLPNIEDQLIIDFENVEMASTSFLDEFIGKLISEQGSEILDKVCFLHMNHHILELTGYVVHSRFEK